MTLILFLFDRFCENNFPETNLPRISEIDEMILQFGVIRIYVSLLRVVYIGVVPVLLLTCPANRFLRNLLLVCRYRYNICLAINLANGKSKEISLAIRQKNNNNNAIHAII